MPEPEITENYIRIRVRDPKLFVDGSFKTIDISKPKGIKAIIGKLKSDPQGSTKIQSYLFDKEKWTVARAEKWVEDNKKHLDWIISEAKDIDDIGWLLEENKLINLTDGSEVKMQPIDKTYECELKDFNEEERSFLAVASTEDVDRDGDVIRANGWKLKNYKKNPVVLLFHNAHSFPVAQSISTYSDEGKLYFKPQFATAEMNPMAEYAWQLYKHRFMRAFSVRFDPIKWADIDQDDDRRDERFYRQREYKSQELLEISMVNLPSNPNALKHPLMHDFIVKSYISENSARFPGEDFSKIWQGHDFKKNYDFSEELKERYAKIEQLKRDKEFKVVKDILDKEIKNLEEEIENEKAIETVAENMNTIQAGITVLGKK